LPYVSHIAEQGDDLEGEDNFNQKFDQTWDLIEEYDLQQESDIHMLPKYIYGKKE
jgi:hypothetical protein